MILPHLEAIRPRVRDLAAYNKELGMTAFYQNHSDAKYVGAMLWEMYGWVKNIPVDQINLDYNHRHAIIEADLSWPVVYDVVKPHVGTIYVKDFQWDGPKAKHVPLGTGRVNPKFFETIKADGFKGPISLYV